MKVLVTDGHNRVALAVVRALGKAGAEVAVVEQERFAHRVPAAFLSRHVSRREVLPSLDGNGVFIEALARAAEGVDVILPVSTNVLLACAASRDRLPARLPIPALDVLRRANDKASILEVAKKAGVPVPEGRAPRSADELEEALSKLRLPAVVKLRDDEGTYLEPARRYAVVRTVEEAREAFWSLHRLRPFPVIQERIVGNGYGVGVLAKEGRVLASFCHRRVREFPPAGGPSALCVSMRDERLEGYAAGIVRELGWTGVAMVEFKKSDDYRLMEVNPRFWGSLPLATLAGVNFPDLLCRLAMGEGVPEGVSYREGVKLRFLPMDLSAAWSAASEGRGGTLWGFFRDLLDPRVRDGIIEAGDLRASIAYLRNRM